jgi:hypothetical protein
MPFEPTSDWLEVGGLGAAQSLTKISRRSAQLLCRAAYYVNPVISGALEVLQSYLVGDNFTYGRMADDRAQEALEDFWSENGLDMLADRAETEFALDGEALALWPDPDSPRIVLQDVGNIDRLDYDTLNGMMRVRVPTRTDAAVFERGEFVWRDAHKSLYNDPRGWPVIYPAIDLANKYVEMIGYRVGFHDLSSRLMAVYYAMVDMKQTPDKIKKDFSEKAGRYKSIPRGRNVITLAMDQTTGNSEKLEFMSTATRPADPGIDARIILRLIGLVLGGLPEHYLGEAGNANKATAGEMSDPVIKVIKKKQSRIRAFWNKVMQAELVRRYGTEQEYTVVTGAGANKQDKKVKASRLEFPWVFPNVEAINLKDVVAKVTLALEQGLVSEQTAQMELGYDPDVEAERRAEETEDDGNG